MYMVGVSEAETCFSSLIEDVEKGKQIIITKHRCPVAKLSPVGDLNKSNIVKVIQKIKEFQIVHTLDFDWKALREDARK